MSNQISKHTIFGNVPLFNGYLVNIDGEVFSKRTNGGNIGNSIHKLNHNNDTDYHRVTLSIANKQSKKSVHRLVMLTFMPDGEDTMVNHKSGSKMDNRIENLEWSNAKHNEQHSWKQLGKVHTQKSRIDRSLTMRTKGAYSIRCDKPLKYIQDIKKENKDLPIIQIANKYGGSRTTISKIVKASIINGLYYG